MPDDEQPPPAVASAVALEPFDSWASCQRRRATLDGAHRVEVSERVWRGAVTRSVTTWHQTPSQLHQPPRQEQPRPCVVPTRRKQPARHAMGTQTSKKPNSKQRRSLQRSAAHHKRERFRVLRRAFLVVRLTVRLRHRLETERDACVLHAAASPTSPPKRRHSPPPVEQLQVTGESEPKVADAASPPRPKRAARSPGPAGLQPGFLLR